MGMFDWINYEAPCPKCGEILNGWQSKDGACLLEQLEPSDVMNFYQSCPKCESWVVANVIVKDYDVKIEVQE